MFKPRLISLDTLLRISSANNKQFNLYRIQGNATALRHNDAGNKCIWQSSGTKICFCSKLSRFSFFVASLHVGKATPFRFTYLQKVSQMYNYEVVRIDIQNIAELIPRS